MGLFDFIKSQVIENIEWTDGISQTIVYRYPIENQQIKVGTRLTVRENQAAVFVNEGKVADVFSPGTYELCSETLPVLTILKSWKYGSRSPFSAEVYYVNMMSFEDLQWSSSNPIMMRDKMHGMLKLGANGTFSFMVTNAEKFMKDIFGENQIYETAYILGQLRSAAVSGVSDVLEQTIIAAADLSRHYENLSDRVLQKIQRQFTPTGVKLNSFHIDNISLPEEVEKSLEIHLNGLQTAASTNLVQDAAASKAPSKERTRYCVECGKALEKGAKYCPECGTARAVECTCAACGYPLNEAAKFCPDCGTER